MGTQLCSNSGWPATCLSTAPAFWLPIAGERFDTQQHSIGAHHALLQNHHSGACSAPLHDNHGSKQQSHARAPCFAASASLLLSRLPVASGTASGTAWSHVSACFQKRPLVIGCAKISGTLTLRDQILRPCQMLDGKRYSACNAEMGSRNAGSQMLTSPFWSTAACWRGTLYTPTA